MRLVEATRHSGTRPEKLTSRALGVQKVFRGWLSDRCILGARNEAPGANTQGSSLLCGDCGDFVRGLVRLIGALRFKCDGAAGLMLDNLRFEGAVRS